MTTIQYRVRTRIPTTITKSAIICMYVDQDHTKPPCSDVSSLVDRTQEPHDGAQHDHDHLLPRRRLPSVPEKFAVFQPRNRGYRQSLHSSSISLSSQHQTSSFSNLHTAHIATQNVSHLQSHQTCTTNIFSHVVQVFCLCLCLGIFLSQFSTHSSLLSVWS